MAWMKGMTIEKMLNNTTTKLLKINNMKNIHKINENIYITSDEEIKEGDWYYWIVTNMRIKAIRDNLGRLPKFSDGSRKIILTTDQDLIADGVQAIDDEFLEWFVKNPSCEEVETYSLGVKNQLTGESGHYKYEIIIPQIELKVLTKLEIAKNIVAIGIGKEEPKQEEDEIIDISDHDGIGNAVYNLNNELPQETLEEAAEKYAELSYYNRDDVNAFVNGAKWMKSKIQGGNK
jgi:hypothetical protein